MKRSELKVGTVYAYGTDGGWRNLKPVVVLDTEKYARARPWYDWDLTAKQSDKGTGVLVAEVPTKGYPEEVAINVTADTLPALLAKGSLKPRFAGLPQLVRTWDEELVRRAEQKKADKEAARRSEERKSQFEEQKARIVKRAVELGVEVPAWRIDQRNGVTLELADFEALLGRIEG